MNVHWLGHIGTSSLPRLDLEHPTAAGNYVDRPWAKGTPLTWQDDITGRLCMAMLAFLSGNPAPDDLHLMIAFIQYHIHAPCWLETLPMEEGEDLDEELKNKIRALRALSLTLKTVADIRQYLDRALNIGLDPL